MCERSSVHTPYITFKGFKKNTSEKVLFSIKTVIISGPCEAEVEHYPRKESATTPIRTKNTIKNLLDFIKTA